jgi:hypothetical protein
LLPRIICTGSRLGNLEPFYQKTDVLCLAWYLLMTVEEKLKTETCAIRHGCSEVRSLRVMSENLILFYAFISVLNNILDNSPNARPILSYASNLSKPIWCRHNDVLDTFE